MALSKVLLRLLRKHQTDAAKVPPVPASRSANGPVAAFDNIDYGSSAHLSVPVSLTVEQSQGSHLNSKKCLEGLTLLVHSPVTRLTTVSSTSECTLFHMPARLPTMLSEAHMTGWCRVHWSVQVNATSFHQQSFALLKKPHIHRSASFDTGLLVSRNFSQELPNLVLPNIITIDCMSVLYTGWRSGQHPAAPEAGGLQPQARRAGPPGDPAGGGLCAD